METLYLQSLTPLPLQIEVNNLKGELNFQYNWEDNLMVISFEYLNIGSFPAPLVTYIEVAEKQYRHILFIIDKRNNLVKTPMFKPEYNILDSIRLIKIEPLVQ